MKKFLFVLLASLLTLNISAQVNHMKFMGIPITGKISSFQSQLIQKGFKKTRNLGETARIYEGYFAGKKAEVFVNFIEKTKIVYRVKVVIGYNAESILQREYEDFADKLKLKYKDGIIEDIEHEGKPAIYISVYEDDYTRLGSVSLFTHKEDSFFSPFLYYLHIDYVDAAGSFSSYKNEMDDL